MAINELETYIINELGKRIGAALSYGVYRGKGPKTAQTNSKSEPLGIRTILKNTNKYYDNAVLSYNVLCQYLGEIRQIILKIQRFMLAGEQFGLR